MKIRKTGDDFQNPKSPPCIWSRSKSTPTVITSAGPIKFRMVQLWHEQRMRSRILVHPLKMAAHAIPEHQYPYSDQNHGPETMYLKKRKKAEIVQQKKSTHGDQYNWTHRPVFTPTFQRIRYNLSRNLR